MRRPREESVPAAESDLGPEAFISLPAEVLLEFMLYLNTPENTKALAHFAATSRTLWQMRTNPGLLDPLGRDAVSVIEAALPREQFPSNITRSRAWFYHKHMIAGPAIGAYHARHWAEFENKDGYVAQLSMNERMRMRCMIRQKGYDTFVSSEQRLRFAKIVKPFQIALNLTDHMDEAISFLIPPNLELRCIYWFLQNFSRRQECLRLDANQKTHRKVMAAIGCPCGAPPTLRCPRCDDRFCSQRCGDPHVCK
jgi:hypothetical protein